MPEAAEIMISSDFINLKSKDKIFISLNHISNRNTEVKFEEIIPSPMNSISNGKELVLRFNSFIISVFMGMSGNWKFIETERWDTIPFCRLRIDTDDGFSLILHGGYLGPKYRVGGFKTKRGPDPIKDFDNFKLNILNNIGISNFDKPLGEVLLNQRYFNGVGAYLFSEIMGRLDISPFQSLNELSLDQLNKLIDTVRVIILESYNTGGGQIKDWKNPFDRSSDKFKEWLHFYGNTDQCDKVVFDKRNLWVQKKFIN